LHVTDCSGYRGLLTTVTTCGKLLIMKILFLILALAVGTYSQVVVPGNPSCNSLGYTSEFKVEPPIASTYNVTGVGSVTFTRNTPFTLSWNSSSPAFVRAVIMKAGTAANVYSYNPAILGQDNLTTPNAQNELSHVSFCYNLNPTAASVSISGRVLDPFGSPIYGAVVTVTNVQDGTTRLGRSNPFGYYTVYDLEVGNYYTVDASAKRREFVSTFLSLKDAVADYNIVAVY
jgi:hypothetical protein